MPSATQNGCAKLERFWNPDNLNMTLTHRYMTECPDDLKEETAVIRDLNDKLRQSFEGGQVLMTQGVNALAGNTLAQVLLAIRDFDDFTEDNDPYGTHEFGSVQIAGETVFFKIDAYDENMEYGSPNPADPEVTRRFMTILLASEY